MRIKTLVSIIIPIYNVERYIVDCLESVGAQTMDKGIECILVDDCGQDSSVQKAEEFIANYHGKVIFKMVHHTQNRGLSAARNTGIREVRGKYLYFLDSDDTISPNCIEELYTLAEKYNADLVQSCFESEYNYITQFNFSRYPEFSGDLTYNKRLLLNQDLIPVTAPNRLVKCDLVIKNKLYFREGIIHEDNHWTFFLAKYVHRMAFCPHKTYFYRCTSGSIMNTLNSEKEIHSFQVRFSDFINNIDSVERGAQLYSIFCQLVSTVDSLNYEIHEECKRWIVHFKLQNNILQRCLLAIIFRLSPAMWLRSKCIALLFRTYKS